MTFSFGIVVVIITLIILTNENSLFFFPLSTLSVLFVFLFLFLFSFGFSPWFLLLLYVSIPTFVSTLGFFYSFSYHCHHRCVPLHNYWYHFYYVIIIVGTDTLTTIGVIVEIEIC